MLHFFYAFTTPSTQGLTGVGVSGSEVLTAGALAEGGGPLENLIGVGIQPSETAGTGVLSMGAGATQSLTGGGVGASETLSAGTLIRAGANSLSLIGVSIAASDILAAGVLVAPGSLAPPALQPGMLTAAQLASIQQTVLLSLPWLGYVQENTETRDEARDLVSSWEDVRVYNCDVELMSDTEEIPVAMKEQAVGSYLVTLPYNAVIQPENRIRINGTTYEIQNRLTNWTDQAAVFVSAEEVL